MSESAAPELLIARLSRDLRPVSRLAPPWQRAAAWALAVLWLAMLLSFFADFGALRARLMAAPDMWISEAAAVLTAFLAGWAALQSAIPGSRSTWALLPLPALVLWLGGSTAGCLRLTGIVATVREPPMHPMVCIEFLLLVSLPLALLLVWQIRCACPLRPAVSACLAGLASAAASASLLALIHPFDATYEDLSAHAVAVVCVIGAARLCAPLYFKAAPKS